MDQHTAAKTTIENPMNSVRFSRNSSVLLSIDPERIPTMDDGNKQSAPVTLSFHNISYTVEKSSKQWNLPFRHQQQQPNQQTKQVLFDISGIVPSGMNALLGKIYIFVQRWTVDSFLLYFCYFYIEGPTGCGKSSLLDILAARKDLHGLSGRVLVDGMPLPASFKYMVGYVVQDDIISGTLTVRENLIFSANVRLPTTVSTKERQRRVNNVIQQLGLQACADTRVGTEFYVVFLAVKEKEPVSAWN